MDKVSITETFKKSDPSSDTFLEVSIEKHNGCCARVKLGQGDTCRTGAINIHAIELDAEECRALAFLLNTAADQLTIKNER